MPLTLPRRVTFVAKAEYFTTPGHQGLVPEEVLLRRRPGADRPAPARPRPRARCRRRAGILDEGDLFGIYPEGTRSHDGRLYRGKTGVARLALETEVPVIPVAVVGTDVVAPPGKKFGTVHPPDRALRQAARLLAATRAWRTTATSCARSPTRSCTRSCGSPARSTSTCTPAKAKELAARPRGRGREGRVERPRGRGGAMTSRHDRRRPEPSGVRAPAPADRARRVVRDPAALAVEDRLFRALAVLRVVLLANTVGAQPAAAATTSSTRRRRWPASCSPWPCGPASRSGPTPTAGPAHAAAARRRPGGGGGRDPGRHPVAQGRRTSTRRCRASG